MGCAASSLRGGNCPWHPLRTKKCSDDFHDGLPKRRSRALLRGGCRQLSAPRSESAPQFLRTGRRLQARGFLERHPLPRSLQLHLAGPLPLSPGLPTRPCGRLLHPFQVASLPPLRGSVQRPGLPVHPLEFPVSLSVRSVRPCELTSHPGESRSAAGPFRGLNRSEISTVWPGKSSEHPLSNNESPHKATARTSAQWLKSRRTRKPLI